MKSKSVPFVFLSHLLLPLLALALAGCAATGRKPDLMTQPDLTNNVNQVARLHVGDTVSISMSGLPEEIPAMEKPIKEDGTISLPDVGRVKAAGKTPGQLEDAIHELYVPKYYTHLNITVKTANDRVYYVRGEVKSPGRLFYTGEITVSKAITSAGDFTDFANRSRVYLTRANGDRFQLDLDDILAGKQPDPPVYPGDQIEVARRIF